MNKGTINAADVWAKVEEIIRENMTESDFNEWISPIKPVNIDPQKKEFLIEIPTKYFYDHIERHYVHLIIKAIEKVTGWENVHLKYRIPFHSSSWELNSGGVNNTSVLRQHVAINEPVNPLALPGTRSRFLNSNLNPNMTFRTFIAEDERLKSVVNMAVAIADSPSNAFGPVALFYGDYGVGKTHLVNSIGWRVLEKFPHMHVFYCESTTFRQMFIDSFENKTFSSLMEDFKNHVNVLIIDDIQLMEGAHKIQEILFEILEYIINSFTVDNTKKQRKQVIMVSDRHPNELKQLHERLISRIKTGVIIDVPRPSRKTRIAIIKQKLENANIHNISEEDIEYIADRIEHSARELEGVVASISIHSFCNPGVPITREIIDKILKKYSILDKKRVTIDDIINVVCEYYGISEKELRSSSKNSKIVLTRHIIAYICRTYLDESTVAIGEKLGGKDHSSVVYAQKTIANRIKHEKNLQIQVEEIVKKLGLR